MKIQHPYQTLLQQGQCEHIVKQSRFLAFAEPLDEEEGYEAKFALAQTRLAALGKRYYDARHLCFAYRIKQSDIDQIYEKYSDDGEPIRTGGFPILQLLQGQALENCLVAVVRYFGGTKLGPGGLARAYRESARESIDQADIKKVIPSEELKWILAYSDLDSLEHWLKEKDAIRISAKEFAEKINITFSIDSNCFQESLVDLAHYLNISLERLKEYSILHDGALK